jgi:hypothetical protein
MVRSGTYELTGIAGAYAGGLFGPPVSSFEPYFTSFNGQVLFEGANAAYHLAYG